MGTKKSFSSRKATKKKRARKPFRPQFRFPLKDPLMIDFLRKCPFFPRKP